MQAKQVIEARGGLVQHIFMLFEQLAGVYTAQSAIKFIVDGLKSDGMALGRMMHLRSL